MSWFVFFVSLGRLLNFIVTCEWVFSCVSTWGWLVLLNLLVCGHLFRCRQPNHSMGGASRHGSEDCKSGMMLGKIQSLYRSFIPSPQRGTGAAL